MNDKIYMRLKKLSYKALRKNEIAVAAIVTKNNKIISEAYNLRQKKHDVTAHAEIIAIKKAARKIKDWRLDGFDIYVTLEPCMMCKSIIEESRISNCYFFINRNETKIKNNKPKVNYLQTGESTELMELFQKSFKKLRK